MINLRLAVLAILGALFVQSAHAAESASEATAFFETKIRPVLVKHCYSCHSLETGTVKGGLRLDTRAASRLGGERGPAVVPGDPNASWLLKAVTHANIKLKMPPKKERLPDVMIADLKKWIEM